MSVKIALFSIIDAKIKVLQLMLVLSLLRGRCLAVVPRPRPAFRRFLYCKRRKAGRGLEEVATRLSYGYWQVHGSPPETSAREYIT